MSSSVTKFLNSQSLPQEFKNAIQRSKLYWTDYRIRYQDGDYRLILTNREFAYAFLLHSNIPDSMIQGYFGIKVKAFHKAQQIISHKMDLEYTSHFFLKIFKQNREFHNPDANRIQPRIMNLNSTLTKMLPKNKRL